MRFRLALLVVVAVSAFGATALASIRTTTVVYHAFTTSGQPAIHVSKSVKGHCFSGSSETNRNDAWRCLTGNFLYDPCFSSSKAAGIVLCPDRAWKHAGIEIKLTKALSHGNKHKPSTKGLPWAMQTTSGLKCVFQGMGPLISQTNFADYACQGGTWLWNKPSRASQLWTIQVGAKAPTQTVGVTKAIF